MIRIQMTSEVRPARTPKSPRNQIGYAYTLNGDGKVMPHPKECRLPLWRDRPPYPEGLYVLCPSSIVVNGYGDLSIDARLVPVQAPAPAPAPK